jgi:hypothetical protein
MNTAKYHIVFLILLSPFLVQAQQDIELHVKALVKSLETNMAFVDNQGVADKEKLTQFKGLFVNDAQLYNVIDPEPYAIVPVLSLQQFLKKLGSSYSEGIRVKIDYSGLYAAQTVHESVEGEQWVSVPVTISIIGLYYHENEPLIHNIKKDLYLHIRYEIRNGEMRSIRIAGIHESATMAYAKVHRPLEYGFYLAPMYGRLDNKSLASNPAYSPKGGFSFATGAMARKVWGPDKLATMTGLGFVHYQTTVSVDLEAINTNESENIDKDGDLYFLYTENAQIKETYTLNYLTLPIMFEYRFSGFSAGSIYFSAGAGFSFLMGSKAMVQGKSSTSGYYPEYHVVLEDIPEYGFGDNNLDMEMEWKPQTMNLEGLVSLGYAIPAGKEKAHTLQIGLFYNHGFTDLGYDAPKYRGDYYEIYGKPSATNTRAFGIAFNYFY